MGKFYLAKGFSIEAGPQIGFLLAAKAKVKATVAGNSNTEEEKIDQVNGVDFVFNLGAGYQLDMGLFFQGRYGYGLSNTDSSEIGKDAKDKNSVIQLSVGYKF